MASNPLNAFLQGFEAVDRLETNRQNRKFMADQQAFAQEQQSQMRKMWTETNDQFAREKLDRYRSEKLAEMQFTMDGIMQDPNTDIKLLNDPVAVMQQVVNDMQAKDSSFGEHIALALGLDPAAGEHITDKANPVSGITLVSPDRDPAGKGGVAFTLKTINGEQPYTDNRSSKGDDPVTMKTLSRAELVKIFGAEVLGGKYLAAQMMVNMSGAEPDGLPPQAQKGTTAPPPPDEQPQQPRETPQTAALATLSEEHRRQAVDDSKALTTIEPRLGSTNVTAFDDFKESKAYGGVPAALAIAADAVGDVGKAGTAGAVYGFKKGLNAFIDFSYAAANAVNGALGVEAEPLSRETATKNRAEANRVQRASEMAAARTEAATSLQDVAAEDRKNLAKVGTDPKAVAKAVLTAPLLTEEGSVSTANALLRGQGKKPNIPQVANAISMVKMGYMTPEQLQNYVNTGELNKAAETKFEYITDAESGVTTVYADGTPIRQDRTGRGKPGPKGPTEEERFDLITKFAEGKLLDKDGKSDKRRLEEFRTEYDTAAAMLGIDEGLPGRLEVNHMAEGKNFIDYFSADPSQNLFGRNGGDFAFWTDPKLGPNNLALGYLAVQSNIVSNDDASQFLYEYGIKYRKKYSSANGESIVDDVKEMESEVLRLEADARNDKLKTADKEFEGMDRNEIRTRLVDNMVTDPKG